MKISNLKKKYDGIFSLRLPETMLSNIESLAMENETTTSEVVRYAINKVIKNEV